MKNAQYLAVCGAGKRVIAKIIGNRRAAKLLKEVKSKIPSLINTLSKTTVDDLLIPKHINAYYTPTSDSYLVINFKTNTWLWLSYSVDSIISHTEDPNYGVKLSDTVPTIPNDAVRIYYR